MEVAVQQMAGRMRYEKAAPLNMLVGYRVDLKERALEELRIREQQEEEEVPTAPFNPTTRTEENVGGLHPVVHLHVGGRRDS